MLDIVIVVVEIIFLIAGIEPGRKVFVLHTVGEDIQRSHLHFNFFVFLGKPGRLPPARRALDVCVHGSRRQFYPFCNAIVVAFLIGAVNRLAGGHHIGMLGSFARWHSWDGNVVRDSEGKMKTCNLTDDGLTYHCVFVCRASLFKEGEAVAKTVEGELFVRTTYDTSDERREQILLLVLASCVVS